MNNPASTGDARLTRYASDPTLAANLDAAWRALQRELPGLVAWIEAGTVSPEDAADVIVAATLRVLRNPDGAEEEAAAIDDYSERTKRADATQDLYFTSAELRRLAPMPTQNAGSFPYTRSFMGYDC